MERSETIERVAAGLRAMQPHKPDVVGFLWMDSQSDDVPWDDDSILGIPVYRSGYVQPGGAYMEYPSAPCPFMPLFRDAGGEVALQAERFVEAFCDWTPWLALIEAAAALGVPHGAP